jgi:biopolymer transport protein ExbB/TolQ
VEQAATGGGALSLVDLIRHADPIVQAVVLGLVLCSVVCWAIILEKVIRLTGLGRQVRLLERLATGNGPQLKPHAGVARTVMAAALSEQAEIAAGPTTPYETRQRLEEVMRTTMNVELRGLEGGLTFLATIGSAAPFIGLFGTVWGIMTSFTSIAQSQDTSLEVVAPGIAEALFATAAGLAAAIPAVIAYNQITAVLARASQNSGAATQLIARTLVREAGQSGSEANGSGAG